jgi:peptide methionine sulfoxide reductase MsrA
MGCFWGPDQFFSGLDGVIDVAVGYTGGKKE